MIVFATLKTENFMEPVVLYGLSNVIKSRRDKKVMNIWKHELT
jgi:hypothetical protein